MQGWGLCEDRCRSRFNDFAVRVGLNAGMVDALAEQSHTCSCKTVCESLAATLVLSGQEVFSCSCCILERLWQIPAAPQ